LVLLYFLGGILINSKGFTLIELLVVISVLGILATIADLSIGRIIENSRRVACDEI